MNKTEELIAKLKEYNNTFINDYLKLISNPDICDKKSAKDIKKLILKFKSEIAILEQELAEQKPDKCFICGGELTEDVCPKCTEELCSPIDFNE